MKNIFEYFYPYLKSHYKKIIFSFIGMIFVALGSAGSAHIMKPIMDDMFINRKHEMIVFIPFAVIVLFSLKALGRFIQNYNMVYVGEDIVREIRNELVLHLMKEDVFFLQAIHNGELISRIISDIGRLQSFISDTLPRLLTSIITAFVLLIYILYQNTELTFYFLMIIPLVTVPIYILSKKMRYYSHASQESNSKMTRRLVEMFNNIETIKTNSSLFYEYERFSKESNRVFQFIMHQNKIGLLSSPLAEVIGSLALALVIYLGGSKVMAGKMTVGEFSAFIAALALLYGPIKTISRNHTKIQDAIAAFERLKSLLSREIRTDDGKKRLSEIENIIFESVSFSYEGVFSVENISFNAEMGRVYAFVGESGSGKTSIMNLIARLYRPADGEILVNRIPIDEYSYESYASKIGVVPQRTVLFNDTIAKNISYPEEFDENRVVAILKKVKLWDYVSGLKDGIYTNLDEFGLNLSGGQRQRILLARALYKNPSILILDEATSSLDQENEIEIFKLLDQLKKDLIIFIVTHKIETVKNADRIFILSKGKIDRSGKYTDLFKEEY